MTKRAMGDLQQQPEGTSVSDNLKLPPGFRFHPRDEEIITFYLAPKVMERDFTCTVIGEVDLNRTEPWDLPGKAKMRRNEWYFFYRKDRKYPTGIRANRATEAGYWKATGKDKEIYRPIVGEVLPELVGMKKTLVFYKGRAPRGEKTNWVMHEFRLEGNNKVSCPTSSSTSTGTTKSSSASKDEWVVCRVFNKTAGTKKTHTPSLYDIAMANGGIDQSIIPMPMPMPMAMQLPILPDFTADPTMSYYSTTAMGSMSVPPMMPPMAGMGNNGLQMNDSLFGNPMAPVMSMSFYHQMGMGATGDNGFMATPESGPS